MDGGSVPCGGQQLRYWISHPARLYKEWGVPGKPKLIKMDFINEVDIAFEEALVLQSRMADFARLYEITVNHYTFLQGICDPTEDEERDRRSTRKECISLATEMWAFYHRIRQLGVEPDRVPPTPQYDLLLS